jgi:hypothetical protein
MDSWKEQRELAKNRIVEIEDKIGLQTQRMERLLSQNDDAIADFDDQAKAIETAIQTEEHRTGVHDPAHAADPSAAKRMIERRDKMMHLIEARKRELVHAKAALDRARAAAPADRD